MSVENVYKAWASTVNASGGISGHPVQVVTEDDGTNPGTSVTAAQTLIADHVVAIADVSLLDQAWASAVQAANIPVVGVNYTSSAVFDTNPDFYPAGQTFSSQIYSIVSEAKTAGAANVGDIYCTEAPACAQTVGQAQTAGQQLGVPDVYNVAVSSTAPNYTAQCVAAQQKHVESVYVASSSAGLMHVASDCVQQGYHPVYVYGLTGAGPNVFTATGLENLWLESPDIPYFASTPGIQAMNTALDKYYPGLRENASLWNETNVESWISGLLLGDAIKAGGLTAGDAPSAAEVITGLTSLHEDTLQGMAPPLTFAAGQTHSVPCWFPARLQNRVPTLLNNGQVVCHTS
jgi:branched-chain amino acid transport system substrate-binding protein